MKSILLPVLLALLSLLSGTPAAAQPSAALKIGVAAGVRGHVMAIAAQFGAAGRLMESGKLVFHNDRVTTDAQGRMQVMLIDETVFTLGPNTDMVLDEFVYDPKTHKGKVVARLTKGVMRFVTGKVAKKKPSNMMIKLPVGTIGIRGTIAAVETDGVVSLVALLGPGPDNNTTEKRGGISVTYAGNTVEIWKPGFGTIVRPGVALLPPFELTPGQMYRLDPVALADQAVLEDDLKDAVADNEDGDADESEETGDPSSSGGEPSGSEPSASELSGQSAASGLETLSDTESLAEFSDELSEELDETSADIAEALPPGVADWSHVRSIQTGTGHFKGSSDGFLLSQCWGGACTGPVTGGIDTSINIDFGARTIGGDCGQSCGSSYVSVWSQAPQSEVWVSDTLTVPETSFASLTGDAVLQVSSMFSEATSATITLLNGGGEAAKFAQVDAVYDDGSNIASGGVLAERQDGVAPQQLLMIEGEFQFEQILVMPIPQ